MQRTVTNTSWEEGNLQDIVLAHEGDDQAARDQLAQLPTTANGPQGPVRVSNGVTTIVPPGGGQPVEVSNETTYSQFREGGRLVQG